MKSIFLFAVCSRHFPNLHMRTFSCWMIILRAKNGIFFGSQSISGCIIIHGRYVSELMCVKWLEHHMWCKIIVYMSISVGAKCKKKLSYMVTKRLKKRIIKTITYIIGKSARPWYIFCDFLLTLFNRLFFRFEIYSILLVTRCLSVLMEKWRKLIN